MSVKIYSFLYKLSQLKSVKVNWRIFIFCTLGTNGRINTMAKAGHFQFYGRWPVRKRTTSFWKKNRKCPSPPSSYSSSSEREREREREREGGGGEVLRRFSCRFSADLSGKIFQCAQEVPTLCCSLYVAHTISSLLVSVCVCVCVWHRLFRSRDRGRKSVDLSDLDSCVAFYLLEPLCSIILCPLTSSIDRFNKL